MHKVNFANLDLNLLRVLHCLLDEKHVSKAADRLHLSQPAVSRALARLRESFNDPLLVRTAQGYALSARAASMQVELAEVLRSIDRMIAKPIFDPATDRGVIKMTGLDLELALYVPQLVQRMRKLAPFMHLETVRQELDSFSMLDKDDVQLSLSGLEPMTSGGNFHRVKLDTMPVVCLMDEDHPLTGSEMTAEEYASAPHGLVSITGRGPGSMDQVLEEVGLQREVVVRLSGFMSVADYCEGTDLVFTLPLRLAQRISAGRKLKMLPLPTALQRNPVAFYIYWHARHHHDPRLTWVRSQLLEITQELPRL